MTTLLAALLEPAETVTMPRKTQRAVTLASRTTGRGKVGRGHDDATPERLAQARGADGPGAAAVDGRGVRRIADAFDLLRRRNLLDRIDVAANETLWHAGDRLRGHWHRAQLDGLSAVDLARPSVDGGVRGSLAPSEAAQRHRDEFRRAAAAIGPRLMPFVTGLVIDGRPVASLRDLVRDTSHARTAEALALERLREGLHRLCGLWSMTPSARPVPIKAWRDEAAGRADGRTGPDG